MSLRIACSKGCGHSIEVTDEVLSEAKAHGAPIDVAHDICPTEADAPKRRYKIVTTVYRLVEGSNEKWEVLSQMGDDMEAASFKLALPMLQESLQEQWGRIVGMQDIVDGD